MNDIFFQDSSWIQKHTAVLKLMWKNFQLKRPGEPGGAAQSPFHGGRNRLWVAQNPWLMMMNDHYSDNEADGDNNDDINVILLKFLFKPASTLSVLFYLLI